jgi:hypothetical protein
MIEDTNELQTTLDRIFRFHAQLTRLRKVETNSENYRHSASGFLIEIDRMQAEVREYLKTCPAEFEPTS